MITQIHKQISLGGDMDCMPGLNLTGTKATERAILNAIRVVDTDTLLGTRGD